MTARTVTTPPPPRRALRLVLLTLLAACSPDAQPATAPSRDAIVGSPDVGSRGPLAASLGFDPSRPLEVRDVGIQPGEWLLDGVRQMRDGNVRERLLQAAESPAIGESWAFIVGSDSAGHERVGFVDVTDPAAAVVRRPAVSVRSITVGADGIIARDANGVRLTQVEDSLVAAFRDRRATRVVPVSDTSAASGRAMPTTGVRSLPASATPRRLLQTAAVGSRSGRDRVAGALARGLAAPRAAGPFREVAALYPAPLPCVQAGTIRHRRLDPGLPVVALQHGFLSNGDAWCSFADSLAAELNVAEIHQWSTPWSAPLASQADSLTRLLNTFATPGRSRVLVGHSQGGLIARDAANRMIGGTSPVSAVVTLDSPHQGAAINDNGRDVVATAMFAAGELAVFTICQFADWECALLGTGFVALAVADLDSLLIDAALPAAQDTRMLSPYVLGLGNGGGAYRRGSVGNRIATYMQVFRMYHELGYPGAPNGIANQVFFADAAVMLHFEALMWWTIGEEQLAARAEIQSTVIYGVDWAYNSLTATAVEGGDGFLTTSTQRYPRSAVEIGELPVHRECSENLAVGLLCDSHIRNTRAPGETYRNAVILLRAFGVEERQP